MFKERCVPGSLEKRKAGSDTETKRVDRQTGRLVDKPLTILLNLVKVFEYVLKARLLDKIQFAIYIYGTKLKRRANTVCW